MSDNRRMPSETEQRRWIQQWQAAREALRAQRASELAAMTDEEARDAADTLLTIAAAVALPPDPRPSSGLVEQQALLHRKVRS
jgi:hypothetical protein